MIVDNVPWQPLEKIGRGSFGDVYKGFAFPLLLFDLMLIVLVSTRLHVPSGKHVAIKVVNLEADDEGIEEMRKEISILSHCHSEYITKYHGSIVCGTKLWIIMDYCGLGSLRTIVSCAIHCLSYPLTLCVFS